VSSRWASLVCAWLVAVLAAAASHAQTPPGTVITNTAQAVFTPPGGVPTNVASNADTITTGTQRTPSATQLFHYAPGSPGAISTGVNPGMCSTSGTASGPFVAAPNPTDLSGAAINLANPADLLASGAFHQTEALFLRVRDPDQNLNPLAVESVLVSVRSLTTGDQEWLQVSESGVNTGEFVGYLMLGPPPAVSGDCRLSVVAGETFRADYTDPADGADSSANAALVDPLGIVFDSQTGAPIDGASVTLIDSASGLPATVFGDDGVSTFPATVLSGGTASDSGGALYTFAPGHYRFPFVAPGTYRIQVVPPPGSSFPSIVPDVALQVLSGAPFALGPGSRGNDFVVPLGPIFQVDVPLDASGIGAGLTLTKRANRATAGIGEFVQYVLQLSAPGGSAGNPLALDDRLPRGFRYEQGSLRIDGQPAPDPTIRQKGRRLTVPLPALASGAQLEIRYVTRVGSGASGGEARNDAIVRGGVIASNAAHASVQVMADLLTQRATLMGRVMEGSCDSPTLDAHPGVAGVRVFLEDGTYTVTDDQGRFHFPLVSPATHVVQIDTQTLPDGLYAMPCAGSNFADRPYSQFVEPQAGALWRTDFFVGRMPSTRGLHQRLTVTPGPSRQTLELRVEAGGAALESLAATLMLPDGVEALPGTLVVDGPGATLDTTGATPVLRAATLTPGQALTMRLDVAGAATQQVSSFARATREGGGSVQTPIATATLAEAHSFLQSASWQDEPVEPKPIEEAPPEAAFDGAWLAAQTRPASRWLYPDAGATPKIPSINLGIEHDPALRVRLFRNGKLVDPLNFEGTERNPAKTVAVSRWRGVDLEEGPNTFSAELLGEGGAVHERLQYLIHYSGLPVHAELMPSLSRMIADGREPPVIAVRLTDRWGRPVREGISGPLRVAPPHQARETVEAARERQLAMPDLGATSFVVGRGGIARIELEPTTSVGRFAVTLQLAHETEEVIDGWLSPGEREFTLVALGTGTRGFGAGPANLSGNASGPPDASSSDGRAAFFAKGTVGDGWTLTGAYDTDAKQTQPSDRIGRQLDPDEHYMLYGDNTQEGYEAPTSDGVYLKAERERFYALYGDYETGLTETELARYSRVLSGVKTEYFGDRLRWNGFGTDSGQQYVRDELRGNGTSGLYRLSRGGAIPNSVRVRLETRDRFRPDRLVKSEPLMRDVDYDIDYAGGTLQFRKPIPGRDELLNPIFVVVEYEVDGAGSYSGGGRVAGRFFGGALELGASGIHEGRGDFGGDLVGLDASYDVDETTKLHAELAGSENDDFGGAARGAGWLLSAEHRTEALELAAYARQQENQFGLGQLSGVDQGMRRYGVDGLYHLNERWSLKGSAFRDERLGAPDERTIAETLLAYDEAQRGAHVGARYVRDDASLDSANTAQLLLGGHYGFLDNTVTLRAASEVGFGSEGPHGDYANRVAAGADWRVTDWLTLFGEHELTFGDVHEGQDTRAGVTVTPWEGGQISTSVGQNAREYGPRTYANLGLSQHWNLFQSWGFDFLVDRSQTISGGGTEPLDPDLGFDSGPTPPADDYTAISLGAAYTKDETAVQSRAEWRMGQLEDQWNVLLGVLREHERTSYAGRLELWNSDGGTTGAGQEDLYTLRFSLVHRPLDTHWIVLEQTDFELGNNQGGGLDSRERSFVNHLKVNYLYTQKSQVSLQYSAKWVGDTIDGRDYTTLGHLFGVEARHDLTSRWDVGLHARVRQLSGHGAGDQNLSLGVSVGRVLYKNVWASVGYNFSGFEDDQFSKSDYTAEGPFLRMRVKVDQDSVRDLLQWPPRLTHRNDVGIAQQP
jgi:hypothetical protein